MKIAPLLIILYIALIGIIIFDNLDAIGWTADPYTNSTIPSNETSVWSLFTNPASWKNSPLISLLTITFLAAAASITIAIVTKSDIALLTPIFVIMINAGILPIIAIYQVVYREVLRMTCTGTFNAETLLASCSADGATAAIILSAIIVGPIAVAWVLTCIEWWTQRPTS